MAQVKLIADNGIFQAEGKELRWGFFIGYPRRTFLSFTDGDWCVLEQDGNAFDLEQFVIDPWHEDFIGKFLKLGAITVSQANDFQKRRQERKIEKLRESIRNSEKYLADSRAELEAINGKPTR